MMFELGRLLATPAALRALEELGVSPQDLVSRHASGDWGDVDADDRRANVRAVAAGDRVLSAYQLADARLYVITEWDRSATTVLLADEY